MKNPSRTILALVVVLLVGTLLDVNPPHVDSNGGNFEDYALWMTIKSAINYFFAAGIGAILGRWFYRHEIESVTAASGPMR